MASNNLLRAPTAKDQKYTPKRVTLKRATRASCSNMGHLFLQFLRKIKDSGYSTREFSLDINY